MEPHQGCPRSVEVPARHPARVHTGLYSLLGTFPHKAKHPLLLTVTLFRRKIIGWISCHLWGGACSRPLGMPGLEYRITASHNWGLAFWGQCVFPWKIQPKKSRIAVWSSRDIPKPWIYAKAQMWENSQALFWGSRSSPSAHESEEIPFHAGISQKRCHSPLSFSVKAHRRPWRPKVWPLRMCRSQPLNMQFCSQACCIPAVPQHSRPALLVPDGPGATVLCA